MNSVFLGSMERKSQCLKAIAGVITNATESDTAVIGAAEKETRAVKRSESKVMNNGEYLRSAGLAEEANYNIIDGLMNNTPKKKDKNAPRRSVLKRLRKHQQKIASQDKG